MARFRLSSYLGKFGNQCPPFLFPLSEFPSLSLVSFFGCRHPALPPLRCYQTSRSTTGLVLDPVTSHRSVVPPTGFPDARIPGPQCHRHRPFTTHYVRKAECRLTLRENGDAPDARIGSCFSDYNLKGGVCPCISIYCQIGNEHLSKRTSDYEL
jgi:hypothetical protein